MALSLFIPKLVQFHRFLKKIKDLMRIDKGFDAKANMGLIQKGKPGAPSLLVCSKTGVRWCRLLGQEVQESGCAREAATCPWPLPANGLPEERQV